MNEQNRQYRSGILAFTLSGICAISAGIIVSLLRDRYHTLPMIGLSVVGLVLWVTFLSSGLPGRETATGEETKCSDHSFLKNATFWLLAMLLFCQNAAEYTVNGWMVTYYKNEQILTGTLAAYTVTVQWSLTLIARLLIAYAIKIRKPFKALAIMGMGLTVAYGLLLRMHTAVPALITLGLFSFSVAGVYPIAVACTGSMMSSASVGLMLAIGGIGGIAFPWLVGIIADAIGLRNGMAINLIGGANNVR